MAGVEIPVTSPDAYANADDLTAYWKAPDSEDRANYLLKLTSNRLREIARNLDQDLDALANDEATPSFFLTLQWVVMEATKRALQAPTDQQPMETYGQTAGPYSENIKYSNPSGDLWFKKAELSAIGLYGRQKLNSISTSRTDIYCEEEETS